MKVGSLMGLDVREDALDNSDVPDSTNLEMRMLMRLRRPNTDQKIGVFNRSAGGPFKKSRIVQNNRRKIVRSDNENPNEAQNVERDNCDDPLES